MAPDELPYEVLELVFSYLHVSDRLAVCLVCKHWYYASLSKKLWKDTTVCIKAEKAVEGLDVLLNCERCFSSVVFQDCAKEFNNNFKDDGVFFLQVLDAFKDIGQNVCDLRFKKCSITGSVLFQIVAECPNLKYLGVVWCNNLFSPDELLQDHAKIKNLQPVLDNITELDLSYNKKMCDVYFMKLSCLFTNLKSLSLEGCRINFSPDAFSEFYGPSTIPVDGIFTFEFIKKYIINNAKKLTIVNFDNTNIDGPAIEELAHIESLQLESLVLSQCLYVTPESLKEFCYSQRKLKQLHLPFNMELHKVLPDICTTLKELQELNVTNYAYQNPNQLSHGLETHALKKLGKLYLKHINDVVVLKFVDSLRTESHPKLKHMSFSICTIDDTAIIDTIPHILGLTYLDLSKTCISDNSLVLISTHLVQLQVLKLKKCKGITDNGLVGHVEKNKALDLCDAGETSSDTDEAPREKSENLELLVFSDEEHPVSMANLKGMRELNIYDISGISDYGIKIAVAYKELKYLFIGGCSKITDEGLIAIGRNNKSLEVLSMKYCTQVTKVGVSEILRDLPRLKLLDLHGCNKLATRDRLQLVKGYKCRLDHHIS